MAIGEPGTGNPVVSAGFFLSSEEFADAGFDEVDRLTAAMGPCPCDTVADYSERELLTVRTSRRPRALCTCRGRL
ncbi:hypothetical protein [Amycolatopsis sp. NPDC059657]|uniref:hypothetical protein n=1 Tax=Amycolatopsis sp. NPDC059657 TaxID=3346899 RepID=UPI00366BA9E1